MATYTITVNGKSYDVEVQKKDGAVSAPRQANATQTAQAPAASAPAAAPSAPPAQTAPRTAPAPGGGGAGTISAPMPGKVVSVKVNVGDNVKKGQELLVVEAMKMHNPVLAANDGSVREILVKPGDPIQTGQSLIVIG